MRGGWVLLALLAACGSDDTSTVGVGDDVGDSDGVTDTEVTDTDDTDQGVDTDDTAMVDTALPDDAEVWHHVIRSINALPADQGFDFDGDLMIDNALGGLSAQINQIVGAQYPFQPQLAVVQTWGAGDADPRADIGLITARDVDDNVADNFTGFEELRLGAGTVGPQGRALISTSTRIHPNFSYDASLPAGLFDLGIIQVNTATPIEISGTVTASTHTGTIGTAVTVAEITVLLDGLGFGWLGGLIGLAADLDLDGDEINESVSMAFAFDAVPCTFMAPAP